MCFEFVKIDEGSGEYYPANDDIYENCYFFILHFIYSRFF